MYFFQTTSFLMRLLSPKNIVFGLFFFTKGGSIHRVNIWVAPIFVGAINSTVLDCCTSRAQTSCCSIPTANKPLPCYLWRFLFGQAKYLNKVCFMYTIKSALFSSKRSKCNGVHRLPFVLEEMLRFEFFLSTNGDNKFHAR